MKQQSTVTEYVSHFTELVDQLKAYASSVDPVYFTTRFVDGLHSDIRSIVLVQRPKDLDTACTLALLQEEAGAPKLGLKPSLSAGLQHSSSMALPLPLPPRQAKVPSIPPAQTPHTSSTDAKLSALRAYYRAMGLCYKCAAKWSKDHQCDPQVLHAVQELWELCAIEELVPPSFDEPPPAEQLFLAISKAATCGVPASRTVRFAGSILDIPLTILLDSGSSSSFISATIVQRLRSLTVCPVQSQVQVAGGGILKSPGIFK